MTDKKKGMTPVTATVIPKSNTRITPLILYLSVNFADLQTLGKEYKWKRPKRCLCCGGVRIWGHGCASQFRRRTTILTKVLIGIALLLGQNGND